VKYFASGAKPPERWRIGIEQEKVAVYSDGRPPAFVGDRGIEELLRRLAPGGFEPIREDGHLLALKRDKESVTVEPGGQVEFSGPALATAVACRDSLLEHVGVATQVAGTLGLTFLGVGLRPWGTLDDIPWLPKRRYGVMREYLPTQGKLGVDMMKRTATVQANFDFDSEQTAAEKMRTAAGVTSIVTALYAASPISEGRPNGYQSFRAAIWLDTDEARCGLLPFVFDEGFGFRDYAEWALDVPMFFVVRRGAYRRVAGMTFRRFLRDGWEGERATMGDWETHLSTLFPEVRLKRYIEVRGADAGPMAMAVGLAALWRGILEDTQSRHAAWALVKTASLSERETLRREVPRAGLQATLAGRTLHDLSKELVAIAKQGLQRLPGGAADAALLEPIAARAASGRSAADDMLEDFEATKGDPAALVKRWRL
jgi:glutamate--cysteine ligase